MEQPGFWAVLPANVRYDKELTPNEKILYTEITAMTQSVGYCYASNKYFSDLYGVAESTIRRYIQHLRELGYVQVVMEGNERRIYQVLKAPEIPEDEAPKNERGAHPVSGALKNERVPAQNRAADPLKNERKNNTRDNNKINNTGAGARASYFPNQEILEIFKNYAGSDEELYQSLVSQAIARATRDKRPKQHSEESAKRMCVKLDKLAAATNIRNKREYKMQVLDNAIQSAWDTVWPVDERDFIDVRDNLVVRQGSGKDNPRMIGADANPEDLF